jgi:hypothetical protein
MTTPEKTSRARAVPPASMQAARCTLQGTRRLQQHTCTTLQGSRGSQIPTPQRPQLCTPQGTPHLTPPCVQRPACTHQTTCRADRSLPALHACASPRESTVLLPPVTHSPAVQRPTACGVWWCPQPLLTRKAEGRSSDTRSNAAVLGLGPQAHVHQSAHTLTSYTHARQGHRGSLFTCMHATCTRCCPSEYVYPKLA